MANNDFKMYYIQHPFNILVFNIKSNNCAPLQFADAFELIRIIANNLTYCDGRLNAIELIKLI